LNEIKEQKKERRKKKHVCNPGIVICAEHYILYCTKYVTARNKLKNNIELINIPFVLNVLLYDDEGESHETNSSVFPFNIITCYTYIDIYCNKLHLTLQQLVTEIKQTYKLQRNKYNSSTPLIIIKT
jgi:hypothetical protein